MQVKKRNHLKQRGIEVYLRGIIYLVSTCQADWAFCCHFDFRWRFITGIFENKIFPNVKNVLEYLQNKDKKILLATSKPTVFAERILKHFEIDDYFHYVGGSNLDGSRSEKDEVISHVLDFCNINSMD